MATRSSLRSFLASARTALTAPASQQSTPLTFVVGNESADLDSLCSAVVLAYIRSNSPPHKLHIPLSNIPRSDLELRTEMTAVLRHASLTFDELLTLSELPEDIKPEDTHWVLVDHNSLTGPLKKFQSRVVGCVDHHIDEEAVKKDAEVRVIEPCGSCMSLVVDESKGAWDAMSKMKMDDRDGTAAEEDDKLARIAMGPIIIDTVNLTAEHKVKPKDLSSIEYLETKLSPDHTFQRNAYNEELSTLKEDLSSLSLRDIFRKDYKQWQEESSGLKLGISASVQNLSYLVSKTDGDAKRFLDEFRAYAAERELDVAGITTASHPDDVFQRNLLVWGVTEKGAAAAKRFVDANKEELKLKSWEEGKLDDGEGSRWAWEQGELSASRKKVAPLLREALKESS